MAERTRWYNDARAVCDYVTSGGTCSTGAGCTARGEPSCQTDAPGGPGTGSHGWPYRYRKVGGFVHPWPPQREPVVEHAQLYSDGSMLVWPDDPEFDQIYPLALRIEVARRHGGKVFRRTVVVIEEWAEVTDT